MYPGRTRSNGRKDDKEDVEPPSDSFECAWCCLKPDDAGNRQAEDSESISFTSGEVGPDLCGVGETWALDEEAEAHNVEEQHHYAGDEPGAVVCAEIVLLERSLRDDRETTREKPERQQLVPGKPINNKHSQSVENPSTDLEPSLYLKNLGVGEPQTPVNEAAIICPNVSSHPCTLCPRGFRKGLSYYS